MYTVVNMIDITDFIPPDSEDNGSGNSSAISANASLSDPNSTWDFGVDDPLQQLNLRGGMPVVVFDENTPAIGNIPTVPSMNFCVNALLTNPGGYTLSGALSGLVTFPNNRTVTMTFANNAVGNGMANQQTLPGYVQPGVQYMWSMYLLGSGTITNIQGVLQIVFQDIFGNTLGSTISQTWIPTTSQQQVNITGTAPANAAYAYFAFGGQTTNATNSGKIIWSTPMFEPMWFAKRGVSYPTPDCNFAQVNSILMPDGTVSRACRRFAGYVEDRVNSYVGKQRHTIVRCASSSKLLETIGLVSASYTSTQDTAILSDVLGNLPTNNSIIGQIATVQQHYFGPSTTLIPGVVIDSISWNNATLRQVLNDLGAQSGSLYFVDAYYYLWYVPPSFAGATIAVSDTPDNVITFPYANFTIEYDFTNPLNTVLVQGSKQKAAVFTETFSGNASTTVFNLTYPPENVHGISISGVTTRTGVDGIDNSKFGASGSGKTYQALINKQAQTLKFATAPVTGTNNVSISYTYEDQVISKVIAADAVAQQKTQFWGLVNDSAITSTPAAKNRGLAELQAYAFERVILNFDLLGIYVPVGSLALFTNQSEGLVGAPFIIQTVQSDLQGGGVDNWQYTAGVYNPTIIDHLRNATKAIQKSPTTANVVVIASIDVALFDAIHVNDSMSTARSTYASTAGADSPIRQFRLGETFGTTAYDISGFNGNGTIHGGVTTGTTGLINHDTNKAMTFNGSTGWIGFPLTGLPTGASPWTIEAWCEVSAIPASGYHMLLGFGTYATHEQAALFLVSTGTTANFTLSTYGGDINSANISTSTNYHVVGTYDGTNTRLYVNGSLVAGPSAFTLNVTLAYAQIGAGNSTPQDFFSGIIDEVTVYNTALSSARILAHYNAGI